MAKRNVKRNVKAMSMFGGEIAWVDKDPDAPPPKPTKQVKLTAFKALIIIAAVCGGGLLLWKIHDSPGTGWIPDAAVVEPEPIYSPMISQFVQPPPHHLVPPIQQRGVICP